MSEGRGFSKHFKGASFQGKRIELRQRGRATPDTQLYQIKFKKGEIHTTNMNKIYQPVITKGMIISNRRVVPFGYINHDSEQ